MRKINVLIILGSMIFLLSRCKEEDMVLTNLLSPDLNEEYSGGRNTVFNASPSAFSFQNPNLNESDGLFFFTGNSLFNQNWVSAPASTTSRDGLGPLLNARSCSGCHFKDGRGRPPAYSGERAHGLLLRLNIGNDPITGPIPDPNYGDQLQDISILGVNREADFEITYETVLGTYPDGTAYTLQKPIYTITNMLEGPFSAGHISPRVAPQMIGLGLLDALDEDAILAYVDELDVDRDGISGRANYVWDVKKNTLSIGRFGWKANQPNVNQQVAAAFSGDMGLTSSLFPLENCPPSVDCDALPNGGSPEVTDVNLRKVTLYSSALAVPGRRDWADQYVLKGKELFRQANCSGCHIPKFTTGSNFKIDGFSNEKIRPYTDLLLHDMGEDLADNSSDFLANGREWKTPPLWGIGLFDIVSGHTFYLHDGRARSIEEAILWHGGEAEESKTVFKAMSKTDRALVIKFLESL